MLAGQAAATPAAHGGAHLVDMYENWAVIVYTLQLPGVFRIGLRTLVLSTYAGQQASLAIAVPILAFEALYAAKLYRHMLALQRRRDCCGRPYTELSRARLQLRLRYLIAKYAPHVPFWQFILWARQLALITISSVVDAYDDEMWVLAEGWATLGVLAVALAVHVRTQPYAHAYQNAAETILASCSIAAVLGACLYYTHYATLAGTIDVSVFEASVLVLLLGPTLVLVIWLSVAGKPLHAATPSELRRVLVSAEEDDSGGVAPVPSEGSLALNRSDGGARGT